tara:strand:+ start:297 stop:1160 length:864 start_codon:yes stop_codon:yes gene_type:complete
MTAFDTAFDLLKRFVLATDSDMILDNQDLFDNDNWERAHDVKLIDTQGGNNIEAGHFTLQNNEAIDDYHHLDEELWRLISSSNDFQDATDTLRWMGSSGERGALKFNENRFPEIHAHMEPKYRRKRLYQTQVLPTLIDRVGGISSDRWNRSANADKAHRRMQRLANQDYRISYRNPKPFYHYSVKDLLNMAIEAVDDDDLLDYDWDNDSLNVVSDFKEAAHDFMDYNRYDEYERMDPQYIQRGWGVLKPSPRIIPIIDLDELGDYQQSPIPFTIPLSDTNQRRINEF